MDNRFFSFKEYEGHVGLSYILKSEISYVGGVYPVNTEIYPRQPYFSIELKGSNNTHISIYDTIEQAIEAHDRLMDDLKNSDFKISEVRRLIGEAVASATTKIKNLG